jgi:hypothetical protein
MSPALQHTEQLLSDLNEHPDYKVNSGDELYKIINQKLSAHTDSFGKLDPEAQASIKEIVRARLRALDQAELKAFGLREVNGEYDIDKIWPGDELDFRVLLNDETIAEIKEVTADLSKNYDIYETVLPGDRLSDYIKNYAEEADEITALRQTHGSDTVFRALVDHARAEEAVLEDWGVTSGKAELIQPGETIAIDYDPKEVQRIVEEFVNNNGNETAETTAQPNTTSDTPAPAAEPTTGPEEAVAQPPEETASSTVPSPEPIDLHEELYTPDRTDFKIGRLININSVSTLFPHTLGVSADWNGISSESVETVLAKDVSKDADFPFWADRDNPMRPQYGIHSKDAVTKTQEYLALLQQYSPTQPKEDETVQRYFERAAGYIVDRANTDFHITDFSPKETIESLTQKMLAAAKATGVTQREDESISDYLTRAAKKLTSK